MPYQYATLAETITDVLSEVTDESEGGQQETVGRLIEAASAAVDMFTNRPKGYFLPAARVPDTDPIEYIATVRRYRGTGTNFLQIGRYVEGTLSIEGVAESLYYLHPENGWIYADDAAGGPGNGEYYDTRYNRPSRLFSNGALYKVSAAWGFAETPSDIVMATKQIVQHIWDRGEGVIGEVSPNGFVIERDMPLSAKTFLSGWIRREFEAN